MARNQLAKKSYDLDTTAVTFTFTGGKTLNFVVREFDEKTRERLAIHGALQKVGDTYAGAETVADAYDAAEKMIAALKNGDWGIERGEADQTLFNEALAKMLTATKGREYTAEEASQIANREGAVYDVAGQKVDAKVWQKAVRGTPDFIKTVAEIRAARATKPADLNAMLAAV